MPPGANDINSFHATPDEVFTILTAVKNSPDLALGTVTNEFKDFPDNWSPRDITDRIFASSDPHPLDDGYLYAPDQ